MSTRGARDYKWLGRTGRDIWTEKRKSEKLGCDIQAPRMTGHPAGTHECPRALYYIRKLHTRCVKSFSSAEHTERTGRSTGTDRRTSEPGNGPVEAILGPSSFLFPAQEVAL